MPANIFLIVLALGASAWAQEPAPAAHAVDPAKMAQIEDLLRLSNTEKLLPQMLGQFEGAFSQGLKQSIDSIPGVADQPGLQADLESFKKQLFGVVREQLSYERLKPELIKLYDQTFTLEEMSGINAFYKSPAGQAYLAKVPLLTQKSTQIGVSLMSSAMPQIQKMTADWTDQMKKKYGDSGAK